MRLCFWRVAPVLLGLLGSLLPVSQAVERHYFIAAVKIKWDYGGQQHPRSDSSYEKVVYREYTAGFKQPKKHPSWAGLLGPTVRGEEGDVIVVTFRNMADREYSIHPHGIAYGKQSEGSLYFDNTSPFEQKDGKVLPEQEHTYYWEVTPEVAPKQSDPPCLTYSYLSHRDFIRDFNSGLIGTLMVCKKGSLNPAGEQIHFSKEYVLLFSVFDETKSWYLPKSTSSQNHVKYTINGYSNGTIPDLSMCAYTSVSWHLLGMSSEPEIFSVHFNGQVLQNTGHRLSSVGLISGTATSINVTAVHPGCWLLSSHATKHLEAGMHGFLNIQTCVGITPPRRRITIQEKRQSQEWTYYIAAEEIIWDYAPNIPDYIDSEYQSKYLKQGRDRIGKKYKKAVFVEYVNETFTVKKENKQRKMETGILGPVIRAQIRDVVKVVFKNKASRPYSIYPHGLTIDKDAEGTYYPEGGNQTHAVQPGQTYTYVWKVIDEDEPTDRDSRCLTRMYHSAVDIPRDIASGLVGHLLICKSQSLNKRNVQLKADKEQQAMLAVFDENKSWYLDENIKTFCSDPSNVNKNSPDFYESNVMHSINGYVYDSGQNLMFCNGEIVTWHMSSVGAQDNIQTVTFYGHSFELNERVEDVLSLFPMTGETITMSMDNLGHWLLTSLNSHAKKGMRLNFKDVECYRDYYYEYSEPLIENKVPDAVSVWVPEDRDELKKRNKDPEPITKMRPPVVDESTDYWASQLGLRSFRNQSNGPIDDVELLDFSLLDIDQNLPASNKTENLSLSFSTLGNNVTDPESSSSQTKTQLTLTEGVALEEPNVTVGSFNESRIESNTRRLNESEDHLWTQFANTLDKDSEVKRNGTEEDNSETTIFILLKNTTTEGSDLEERTKTIVPLAEPNLIIEEPKTTNPSETFKGSYILNTSTNSSEDIVTINNHAFTYIVGETHGTPSNTTVRVEDFLFLDGADSVAITYNHDKKMLDAHHVERQDSENMHSFPFATSAPTTVKSVLLDNTTSDTVDVYILDSNLESENNSLSSHFSEHSNNFPSATSVPIEFKGVLIDNTTSDSEGYDILDSDAEFENNSLVNQDSENLHNFDSNASIVVEAKEALLDNTTSDTENKYNFDSDVEMKNSSLINQTTESPVTNKTEKGNNSFLLEPTSGPHLSHDSLSRPNKNETGELATTETQLDALNSNNCTNSSSAQEEQAQNVTRTPEFVSQSSSEEEKSDSKEQNSMVSLDGSRTGSSGLMNLSSSDNYTDTHWNKQQAVEAHRSNISVAVPKTDVTEDEDVENSSKENMTSSSENGGDVMIYLQDNSKEAIFTSSLDRPRKHWSYDGKHKIVQLEMTENMTRYIKEDSNSTVNKKKTEQKPKSKMKYKRRRPMKMYAVKTRKKKVYKPQPRSELSPRGFMPPALNPRGARPIFSEEDLTEKPVVIGVPRQDFNDYDIYIPTLNDDLDHIDIPDEHKGNEYEYVNYKDPYGKQTDEKARYFSQVTGENVRTYFIAAVEMEWDYEGYGQRRQERSDSKDGPTKFTKVIFRRYLDTTFTIPEIRGETDEHLGILGPIIKAEVDETIMVVFKNLAGRPYSLHAHGVSYSKQMEGLKYDDNSPHWYKLDNEVLPNESYTYIWKVEPKAGPKRHDSDCRMWPYYSGVNPEKDIHSGLVGPLLICREGTLNKELVDMREFILLFMSFDETKSWYYEKNLQRLEMKNKRAVVDPQLKDKLKFHAINGIIYSLKGLRMYTNQLVRWHVFNMGSSKDVQSIHFHGQTFVEKRENEYRQGVHLLLPGSFSTLEMWPSKPGLWLLESEVGEFQQKGMQTLFLIIDIDCAQPLGLISHSVKDSQITASHYTGEWKPHLARLHNIGKYNAWSTDRSSGDWIQVDFQRPVVISKVATQGAKQFISSHYVLNYTVSYRTDGKNWITYKTFSGNKNSYEVKENTFFPPLIGRYVRLYPLHSYNRPTIRMEFYGCELDGCSVPLGMEQRTIKDSQITASSSASNWLHGLWHPWLARLNNQGAVNAWQAKYNDMQQWLQVELKDVKKITGIVTQGAKSMGKEMYVMSYIIQYSDDGKIWKTYNEDNEYGHPKVFVGNTDNNDHAKNYIYPPIFSKFIRIVPQRWERAITMRIELLGCDFE
ncbi:coagulation factor V [Scleropages formosus]|uniref:coagulation factor V n=1 Tax=Scleropages formosus TaxID=113540 RepID=UPI0010FA7308|nr:coagulation factor V [Scleropages formosus]